MPAMNNAAGVEVKHKWKYYRSHVAFPVFSSVAIKGPLWFPLFWTFPIGIRVLATQAQLATVFARCRSLTLCLSGILKPVTNCKPVTFYNIIVLTNLFQETQSPPVVHLLLAGLYASLNTWAK